MSTLTPSCVLVGWNKVQEQQKEDRKANLKISGCVHSSFQDVVKFDGEEVDFDILWVKDDQNCISEAESQGLREEIQTRTLDFLGNRFGNGIANLTINTSSSVLSRGVLKRREGNRTIHFIGDSFYTELLFQTIHSVNQISIYAATADWCHQFGWTDEERERVAVLVDKGVFTVVETEEIEMLMSLPNLALGNKIYGGARFRILEKRIQMT